MHRHLRDNGSRAGLPAITLPAVILLAITVLAAIVLAVAIPAHADREKEGETPPSTRTPTVLVTPIDSPLPPKPFTYDDLDVALRSLDFTLLAHEGVSPRIRDFGQALENLTEGRSALAMSGLEALTSGDDAVAIVARRTIQRLLFDARSYETLYARTVAWHGQADAFTKALATLPNQRLTARARALSTGLARYATGSPIVDVEIAGTRYPWALDTGAGLSVVRRSDLEALGARLIPNSETEISTATEITLRGSVAVVPRLEVGSVTVYDHAVLVFPDQALDLTLPDGTSLSLRGILGWNVLRDLHIELDFVRARSAIRIAVPAAGAARASNLLWLGYPLVRLSDAAGRPLVFGLDTGSRNTSMSPALPAKIGLSPLRREMQVLGGAGGSVEMETEIADHLDLVIEGHHVRIPEARTEPHDDAFFVDMDGVLGADIAQRVTITIDYTNGHFGITTETASRGKRD